jgi:PAS domain S-box-containing protein
MSDLPGQGAALDALRESEARFEAFMAESPAVAWMKDAAGRYVYVNETLLRVYGFTRAEILGKTDLEVLPRAVADQLRQNDERVRASRAPVETVERIPDAEGLERAWRIWKFPFETQGGQLHVGGLAFDITEQLLNEEAVRRMQRLDSVGRLAAGIAHDFNNLLTVQQIYLSTLRGQERLGAELCDAVERVAEASERAASLTRQLLMFSRQQVMRRSVLHLNAVVERLADMLRRLLGEPIELTLSCDERDPRVLADAGMLEQVLMNLSLNARDAMPDGGRLEIGTRKVVLDERAASTNPEARPGQFVCLEVTDSGIGIPEANLPKLFEPFFTTKEVGQGTGLGMPTAHGIVKQHEGWIEVTSRVGAGTSVRVYLPEALEEEHVASRREGSVDASPAALPAREGVLLVEDEPNLRRVVELVLRRSGYQVFAAADGLSALAHWEQHKGEIDLLLTDLVMPAGLSGRALAERLWQERPHLKVLFTSGYSPETDPTALVSERSSFLQKPYVSQVLEHALRKLLDG